MNGGVPLLEVTSTKIKGTFNFSGPKFMSPEWRCPQNRGVPEDSCFCIVIQLRCRDLSSLSFTENITVAENDTWPSKMTCIGTHFMILLLRSRGSSSSAMYDSILKCKLFPFIAAGLFGHAGQSDSHNCISAYLPS